MINSPHLGTPCPSDQILKNYLAGFLPEDSATRIEQHLSQCTVCEDLMLQIDSQASCDELLLPIKSLPSSIVSPCASPDAISDAANKVPPILPRPWLPWMTSREIGPYELIEPLGHGGMGLVYLARHRKLDRMVAIKLLPAHHQNADARVRFEREILATGRLQHPAIVSATDAGQFGDMDYLVMEYIRGLDLGRLSKGIPLLSTEEVCEIGRQIAIGLSYAHAQGFVHRDIKPSNIMLDENGIVKILDFGLVLFDRWDGVSNELTTVGQFLGTLDYMAPEQAERCGAVDFRADLYALGATLFKLLCGRAPLAAAPNQSPIDKLRLLATHRPPSLRTLRPDAPEQLSQIVDGLLSTSPQSRPASAAHVAEDLQTLAKQGCLVDLIARARLADTDAKPGSDLLAEKNSYSRPNSYPSDPDLPLQASSRNGKRWLPWVAAALVPLAFLAGYFIQFDTPEGQFVVESEIAGVQLKIVKAGAETKNLKIEIGNSATKLSAGKYELTLDSPSDGVTIDRDSFVIERGKVVIARVRKATGLSAVANSLTSQAPAADTQAPVSIYEGKTLSEWLEVARREKERKSWLVAMAAVKALTDADQKKELLEEMFQLCLSKGELSVSYGWGFEVPFANRMAHEMEKASPEKRLELAKLAGENFSEHDLNPIWQWIENRVDQDPDGTRKLVGQILADDGSSLGRDVVRTNQGLRLPVIGSVVYLAKHFPKVATLFDDYLLANWDSNRTNSTSPATDLMFHHVRGLALTRLEKFDKGFADNIAALAIILERDNSRNGSFLDLSTKQNEMVGQRTVDLICCAWSNRRDPFPAAWTSPIPGILLDPPPGITWESTENKLSVPRLLYMIHFFFQRVQPDISTQARILDALAVLEKDSRDAAMQATVELSKDLKELPLSNALFNAYNFRLKEKLNLGGNRILYQLPSSLSAEQRVGIDDQCFAYNLHRYVSFLLWDRSSSHRAFSPQEIGTRVSAFRMLDLNQDWTLGRDEWVPGDKSLKEKLRLSEFSNTITADQLTRLAQSQKPFLRLDLNQDHRLSTEEAIGIDDFSGADRNGDGFLTLDEYIQSRR